MTRSGTGNDFDVTGVNVYQDANGNGTLEPTLDTWISSGTTFNFVNQVTTVTLSQNLIVTPTTSYIFVTYDFNPAAVQASQGATIRNTSDIFPADGQVKSLDQVDSLGQITMPGQVNSSTIMVMPSLDELDLSRVNDSAGGFSVPAIATQGDKNVPIMKLTLQARNPAPGGGVVNTVVLTHLCVDRGNPNHLNYARDVDAVHLYYDNNGNGNFDVGVDTEVTNSNQTYTVRPIAADAGRGRLHRHSARGQRQPVPAARRAASISTVKSWIYTRRGHGQQPLDGRDPRHGSVHGRRRTPWGPSWKGRPISRSSIPPANWTARRSARRQRFTS